MVSTLIIVMQAGLVCTTHMNVTTCEPATKAEVTGLVEAQLIASYQRQCMNSIPASERSRYIGGWIQLAKDCEAVAKNQVKALKENTTRTVDQNGLQR